jgi:hypothetical protein
VQAENSTACHFLPLYFLFLEKKSGRNSFHLSIKDIESQFPHPLSVAYEVHSFFSTLFSFNSLLALGQDLFLGTSLWIGH